MTEEKMKSFKAILCAILMFSAAAAYAEDADKKDSDKKETAEKKEAKSTRPAPATLITLSDSHFSGYGALACQETRIGKKFATLAGGRGGLIINDSLVIGASGYGLAYPSKRSELQDKKYSGEYPDLEFGYGGLLLEYHVAPKSLFHLSFGTTIGAGGYTFTDKKHDDKDDYTNHDTHTEDNVFFVVEPEVGAWLNVTRFCRIGTVLSYRFTNGADGGGFSDKDFRSLNIAAVAQFGWF